MITLDYRTKDKTFYGLLDNYKNDFEFSLKPVKAEILRMCPPPPLAPRRITAEWVMEGAQRGTVSQACVFSSSQWLWSRGQLL